MDREKVKEILGLLSLPIILVGAYLIFLLVWNVADWPNPEELIKVITGFFDQYGVVVVLASSFIEGLLLVGNYFPGGIVIFLGVISAGDDLLRAVGVVGLVTLGLYVAYYLNYILGKYGWYRLFVKFGLRKAISNSEEKVRRHAFSTFLFSYWSPSIAAVTSTAAGVVRLEHGKFLFYSFVSLAVWNIFWGSIVFIFGEGFLRLLLNWVFDVFILLIWVGAILLKFYWWDKRKIKKDLMDKR